jgi:hypothetical protein
MPSSKVAAGTMAKRHLNPDQGSATKLPMSKAQPAVRNGGK